MLSVWFLGKRTMRCRSQDPKRDPAFNLANPDPPIEVATYDDAILGKRGVSGDRGDGQRAPGAADLGEWVGIAAELLVVGQGPGARVIGDDAVRIAVDVDGDPAGADRLAEHDEVAAGIFLRPED